MSFEQPPAKRIELNRGVLDEPVVRAVAGIDRDAELNLSDGSFVAERQDRLIELSGGAAQFAAGSSEKVLMLPDNATSFVPANSTLIMNVSTTSVWSYPRYGAAAFLQQVRVSSAVSGSMIEDVNHYYRVAQKLADVDFNSTYVRQHLNHMEGVVPPPVTATVNIEAMAPAAGAAVFKFSAASLGAIGPKVGDMFRVNDAAWDYVTVVITAVAAGAGGRLDATVRAVANHGALPGAINNGGAGTGVDVEIGFYPADPDYEAGTGAISAFWSAHMRRMAKDLAAPVPAASVSSKAGIELLHSFYASGFLSGDKHRHLWATRGLSINLSFTAANIALCRPAWLDLADGTYTVEWIGYRYESIQYTPAALAQVQTLWSEMSADPDSAGPLEHFTTATVVPSTVANPDTELDILFNRSRESVDQVCFWRGPTTAVSTMTVDTMQHAAEDYSQMQLQYAGDSFQFNRAPFTSMMQLFNRMYIASEHNSSRAADTMNIWEWRAKPYVVYNTQHFELSDNYTGLRTSSNQNLVLRGRFSAVPAAWSGYLLVNYRQRLIYTKDDAGWRVEALQSA